MPYGVLAYKPDGYRGRFFYEQLFSCPQPSGRILIQIHRYGFYKETARHVKRDQANFLFGCDRIVPTTGQSLVPTSVDPDLASVSSTPAEVGGSILLDQKNGKLECLKPIVQLTEWTMDIANACFGETTGSTKLQEVEH